MNQIRWNCRSVGSLRPLTLLLLRYKVWLVRRIWILLIWVYQNLRLGNLAWVMDGGDDSWTHGRLLTLWNVYVMRLNMCCSILFSSIVFQCVKSWALGRAIGMCVNIMAWWKNLNHIVKEWNLSFFSLESWSWLKLRVLRLLLELGILRLLELLVAMNYSHAFRDLNLSVAIGINLGLNEDRILWILNLIGVYRSRFRWRSDRFLLFWGWFFWPRLRPVALWFSL